MSEIIRPTNYDQCVSCPVTQEAMKNAQEEIDEEGVQAASVELFCDFRNTAGADTIPTIKIAGTKDNTGYIHKRNLPKKVCPGWVNKFG